MNNYLLPLLGGLRGAANPNPSQREGLKGSPIRLISPISPIRLISPINPTPPPMGGPRGAPE